MIDGSCGTHDCSALAVANTSSTRRQMLAAASIVSSAATERVPPARCRACIAMTSGGERQ